MLNLISLIIGLVALVCAAVAFFAFAGLGQLADYPFGGDRGRYRRP